MWRLTAISVGLLLSFAKENTAGTNFHLVHSSDLDGMMCTESRLDAVFSDSPISCCAVCKTNSSCLSVFYNSDDKRCTMCSEVFITYTETGLTPDAVSKYYYSAYLAIKEEEKDDDNEEEDEKKEEDNDNEEEDEKKEDEDDDKEEEDNDNEEEDEKKEEDNDNEEEDEKKEEDNDNEEEDEKKEDDNDNEEEDDNDNEEEDEKKEEDDDNDEEDEKKEEDDDNDEEDEKKEEDDDDKEEDDEKKEEDDDNEEEEEEEDDGDKEEEDEKKEEDDGDKVEDDEEKEEDDDNEDYTEDKDDVIRYFENFAFFKIHAKGILDAQRQCSEACEPPECNIVQIGGDAENNFLKLFVSKTDYLVYIGHIIRTDGSVGYYLSEFDAPYLSHFTAFNITKRCIALESTGNWTSVGCQQQLASVCKIRQRTDGVLFHLTPAYWARKRQED